MTRWVALALRIVTLWLVWTILRDLYVGWEIIELAPVNSPGMPMWVANLVADSGLVPGLRSSIFRHIAIAAFVKGLVAWLFWTKGLRLARFITAGIEDRPGE